MSNYFKHLEIKDWQQFSNVEVEFHDRLTILTGANASGKTTLLNLLGKHHQWDVPSLAVPTRISGTGAWHFIVNFFRTQETTGSSRIGSLLYSNGKSANLTVPTSGSAQYQVTIDGKQPVTCFFVPSHRSVFS